LLNFKQNFSQLVPPTHRRTDVREPQTWLLQMRGKSKSVIILHHAGKDGSSRGTSRRQDALDTVIKLERPYAYQQSDGAVFEVHFEKTRSFHSDAAEPVQLSHTIEDGISCWQLSQVTNEKEEEVVRLIEEGMKQVDVAEAIGVSQSNVSKLLKSARAKNLI
jgi:putative DNA primase/helicase